VRDRVSFGRRLAAEAVGTAFLLAAVVGSGIMGQRLSAGNVAIALLANTLATGAALVALILAFGPVSGAHFNPAVTLVDAWQRGGTLSKAWKHVPGYVAAQLTGAFAGVAIAHLMFGEPIYSISSRVRSGGAQAFSEFVATFGLIAVIWGVARTRPSAIPFAVGAYITAAYWFTASTSFANPAVTLARSFTNTFSGIRPIDAPPFIAAQLLGAVAATTLFMKKRKRVLILCTGNSARSQMAEGLWRHEAGDRFDLFSAGTKPSKVRPEAIAVMHELGINVSGHRSKSVDEFAGKEFDYVITVCDHANEICPVFPGRTERLHWPFEDPTDVASFRKVRDQIRARIQSFVS
jgi:thioredoxin type arsenate reductase